MTMIGGHHHSRLESRGRAAVDHPPLLGILLPRANLERVVHRAGVVAAVVVVNQGNQNMKFITVGGESLAGGEHHPQVERVESPAVAVVVVGAHLENPGRVDHQVAEGGLLVHHHGAHPENRASLVVEEGLVGAHPANLESQAVEEDGLVHHHHGARPANPERVDHHGATVVDGEARDRNQRGQNQKGRNRNLPRADIGLGRIVPPIHGNLVVAAAGRPPPESQANQGLHLVEADGMERMTMIGQEVEVILPMMIGHQKGILPLPTTSPANLAMTMIGQEAGKEAILPPASPSLPLLRHIPLVGKMMAGMPTSTTRLTLKAFVKSVTH
mmetsp:Transcript_18544/g.31550  ORF Transcript_18544/g.31550 Transcript_18544/m.31550 type:complete len:328 (-) Transcript_18544:958-1941(-)